MAMDQLYGRENKWKKKIQKSEADTRSKSYHSLSYHRFFENYTEYTVTGKNGKKKIVRNYTGPVYIQNLSMANSVILKVFFSLIFVILVWLIWSVGNMESQQASGTAWYLTVTELLTILSLAYMGYTLLTGYLTAPKRMTSGDYNSSSKALIHAGAGTAICYGADAVFVLFGCLLRWEAPGKNEWMHIGCFLTGAVLALLLFLIERSVPYQAERPAERPADDEGMEILYR